MPSDFTENYSLNQWSKDDRVLMEDFNADNAKIDATIKAEVDARTAETAALTAAVAKCGNCRIYIDTYVGTGGYGKEHPTSYTFPGLPVVFFIFRPSITFLE